ncbi:MAG: response regulator transcription factor [Chloroflexi bacterium]|nr:response regulator transcription factor [Chloroflexota bacterium]
MAEAASQVPLRLLLVDDHHFFRIGLSTVLSQLGRFEVCGEAGDVAGALAQATRCQPDVVLMDVRLPDGSGVEACREIRSEHPGTKVIMLTAFGEQETVVGAILAGASGYLLKELEPACLVEGIEFVAKGGSLLDLTATTAALEWIRKVLVAQPNDPFTTLNERERSILPLMAEGKTNREIARALYLSEHTVKTYVSSILRKLHLHRRAEAAAFIAQKRSAQAG